MEIKIDKREMPLFEISCSAGKCIVLLDTGATFTVYTKSEQELLVIYPDAVNTGKIRLIGGFGEKDTVKGIVYVIPEVILGELIIRNLPVAVCPNDDISADFVLSSFVFKRNPFCIDYVNQKLTIDTNIADIRCGVKLYNINPSYIEKFYVFTQSSSDALPSLKDATVNLYSDNTSFESDITDSYKSRILKAMDAVGCTLRYEDVLSMLPTVELDDEHLRSAIAYCQF